MRERYAGDAYRCVVAARLHHRIYVLHAFKKKSTRGIQTPLPDIALIRRRLAVAIEDDARYGNKDNEGVSDHEA
ncbi:MAG: type II toxin-antitoxin system RelE/ParE family toxin [Thermomicrobiales bacterium]